MTKAKKQKGKFGVPGLQHLLSYRRAHNSVGEKQYITDHIMPLNPQVIATPAGEVMAFIVRVGGSPIMFTSHTDSVHMNVDQVWQVVHVKDGLYCKNDNQPLGADDAAGNWLMFHMIYACVPGVYAFFRGEERGGIGSSYCAKHCPELFHKIKCAIALDRRGTTSVITHQGAGRGCSDEFGLSLAKVLNMNYRLDQTGIYTDTAEFFDIVDNCTNLSVGYEREHSKMETLDQAHIKALKKALIAADWSQLDFTLPRPDPIVSPLDRGYSSLWKQNDFKLSSDRDHETPDDLFEVVSRGASTPLEIADFLFDTADQLPQDLRDKALALSQKIYKRFE